MPTLTIQPSNIDNHIFEHAASGGDDTNFGTTAALRIGDIGAGAIYRALFKFDFSALPDNIVITSATFSLYFFSVLAGTPEGRTLDLKRLTQTGWVELESTWNDYSTGNAWVAGGGDFTETLKASTIIPAVNNWIDFDVLGQVSYAIKNVSKVAHFIVMDANDDDGSNRGEYYSKDEVTQTTLRPKLVIEYFLISTLSTALPKGLFSGVSETFPKDGWENEKNFFLEQASPSPCSVQYWDLFVDTTNE